MRVGDVVKTKSLRVEIPEGGAVTGTLGYKAPTGERFVFVLLGSEPADGTANLEPLAVFEALGWRRPFSEDSEDDVDAVAHSIAEHGVGRPWDDIPEAEVSDICRIDLRDYARAAIRALASLAVKEN